jgi:hypothetical protein
LRWIADYFSKFGIGGSESTRTRDGWLVKHNFKHLINAEENSDVLVFSIAFEAVICQIFVISSHNFLALMFSYGQSYFRLLPPKKLQFAPLGRLSSCPPHHHLDHVVKFCWWGLYLLESPLLHFDYFQQQVSRNLLLDPRYVTAIVEKADCLDLISVWA